MEFNAIKESLRTGSPITVHGGDHAFLSSVSVERYMDNWMDDSASVTVYIGTYRGASWCVRVLDVRG